MIKSLCFIIDEKSSHEKALQEQVYYLTKKLFGSSSERRSDDIPGQQNLFDEAEMEQELSLLKEETVIREWPLLITKDAAVLRTSALQMRLKGIVNHAGLYVGKFTRQYTYK